MKGDLNHETHASVITSVLPFACVTEGRVTFRETQAIINIIAIKFEYGKITRKCDYC